MEDDQLDTVHEDAQAEQDDSAENESEESLEEQDADDSEAGEEEPKLYAGKFKSVEDLEKSYEEIQRFTGSRKELEAKAALYDREMAKANAAAAARSQVPMPKLQQYVGEDGAIDVVKYDAHMEAWQAQQVSRVDAVASKRSQETADIQWAYQEFPYMKEDEVAAQMVMDRYQAGRETSIRESAIAVNAMLGRKNEEVVSRAKAEAQHELSKKSRGNTERPNSRSSRDSGEMTEAKFARMSQPDQQKYINEQFKKGLWGKQTT